MAGVIQKPDALNLSGNLKPFVIITTETVSFVLKKGEVILLQQSYEPGPGNRIEIDIKDVVTATLLFQLNASQLAYIQPDLVANFTAKIGDTDYPFRVIRGGVSNLVDTAANWLKLHFLTWQPRVKDITYYSPEWLTYYAVDACSVKLKATYPDKTSRVITLHSCPAGTAVTLNVQYSVIAGKLGKTYPSYYEVWTETSGGAKLSETQVYAFSEILSEDEQWYIFENSLGGLDSFRAYGTNNLNAEHEHNVAEFGDVREEYQVDTERKYTKNTGYLDEYARRWMLDFFPSRAKYVYEATAIRKIVVTESNVTYVSSDLPSSYTFTWQLAEVSALLNLVKNESDIPDNLVAPDLSSPDFILPPRLAEFPRVQLTEGVLIPAFDPHNPKPTVTTFGAIHDTIKNSVIRELEDELASIGGGGDNPGGGCDFEIIESTELGGILPTDDNIYSALSTDFRITEELEEFAGTLDERYLRKDIDDKALGNIEFDKNVFVNGEAALTNAFIIENIYSNTNADSFKTPGFHLAADGTGWFGNMKVKGDAMFAGSLSSPTFVSGFPNGIGWMIAPYKRINAAGVEETKYKLEIDDATFRGNVRVFEFIVSQLLGENDNRIFAGMMEVDHYDPQTGRLYLDTDGGRLYNPFRRGDVCGVQQYQGSPSLENNYNIIKQYEFVVEEVAVGDLAAGENRLDWIKFKNFVGDLSLISKRDTVTRLDNVENSTRKGIMKITTIDEFGTPYMDVIYGMKTDPLNSTKARIGNLGGLVTPYFGRLDGYGGYFENIWARGKFILENTGEDISTKFGIIEGNIKSEISSVREEVSAKDNYLTNASFSTNTFSWETTNDMHLFSVNKALLSFNKNFYSNKKRIAAVTTAGARSVLRIKNSVVRQLNENLAKNDVKEIELTDGSITYPIFYISFFFKAKTAGSLTVGFESKELFFSEQIEPKETYELKSFSGKWDGTGDFVLKYTGDILIYSLSLSSNPLEDYKIEMSTRFEQTDEKIGLYGKKINAIEGQITDIGIEINNVTESLSLYARQSTVNELESRYDASLLELTPQKINLMVSQQITNAVSDANDYTDSLGRTLQSSINIQAGSIEAVSRKVNSLGETISSSGWITHDDAVSMFATSEDIENSITVALTGIELNGNTTIKKGNDSVYIFDPKNPGNLLNINDNFIVSKEGYLTSNLAKIGPFIVANGIIQDTEGTTSVVALSSVSVDGGFIFRGDAYESYIGNRLELKLKSWPYNEFSVNIHDGLPGDSPGFCRTIVKIDKLPTFANLPKTQGSIYNLKWDSNNQIIYIDNR